MTYFRDHARVWDPFRRYKYQTWIYTSLHLGWCHNGPYSWGRTLSSLFGCIHFIKKRNSGYVSGSVFPGSHVHSCWDHSASQADELLCYQRGSFPQFLFGRCCCYKGVGPGVQIFYTPNLLWGFFLTIFQSLGVVFPCFGPHVKPVWHETHLAARRRFSGFKDQTAAIHS